MVPTTCTWGPVIRRATSSRELCSDGDHARHDRDVAAALIDAAARGVPIAPVAPRFAAGHSSAYSGEAVTAHALARDGLVA